MSDVLNDSHATVPTRQELLQDGLDILAGGIAAIAAQRPPEVVAAYLNVALTDTEGLAQETERMAALTILAAEQRLAIRGRAIETTAAMVTDLDQASTEYESPLQDNARNATAALQDAQSIYQEYVRPLLVGESVDPKAAGRAHQGTADEAERAQRTIGMYGDTFGEWSRRQQAIALDGNYQLDRYQAHMEQLDKAERATDPTQGAERIDTSNVIDETVRLATAARLHEAAKQAERSGESPKDAVYALLVGVAKAQESVRDDTVYLLADLKLFAGVYAAEIHQSEWRTHDAVKTAQNELRSYISIGNDYGELQSKAYAETVEHSQQQSLYSASNMVGEATSIGSGTFANADAHRQHVQARLEGLQP